VISQRGDTAVTRNNLAHRVLTVTQGGSERAAPAQADRRDSSDEFLAITSAEGMQSQERRELLGRV